MRAMVRTANGDLVEGEIVSIAFSRETKTNACAGNPLAGQALITVNGQQWQPLPMLPPPAAACAGNPTAYLWHQT